MCADSPRTFSFPGNRLSNFFCREKVKVSQPMLEACLPCQKYTTHWKSSSGCLSSSSSAAPPPLPPPPPPLPPGSKQLNSPFSFKISETLRLEDFHPFTFIIRRLRATGCQFLYLTTAHPQYGLLCIYCMCRVH